MQCGSERQRVAASCFYIVPAAVATMVPTQRRPSAYGLFTAGYGVAWFIGSALMGILYDVSIIGVVIFCVGLQLAAVPIFLKVRIWLAQNLQWHEISSAISRNLCQLLFRDGCRI